MKMIRIIAILSLIFLSVNVAAQKDVSQIKPIAWVNDFGNILTNTEIKILDSTINTFEKQTTIEIAIVTFDSSFSSAENFDSLVTSLGRAWGIGKKETNNGIIIGVSESLRKIRISNGYGIEKRISNDETRDIIDKIILPEFKQANYFEGLKKGLAALMKKLAY